ncbi:MAG: putative toxin-antitoxin system toxin component, PIN family [Caldithrix sp. RBG_13_44_9]|nr:MAG: putative toxin-antitoxin system toxin component, PIN family [Caldithrix sp. RBG_13_44_9]
MKIVLDTNVLISSFLGTGNPRKIIDLWKNGEITLCLSREILQEYFKVLQRLSLTGEKELEEIAQLFATGYHTLFVNQPKNIKINLKNQEDIKLFECAFELKADLIVSGDKSVLNVREYFAIKVLSPTQFIDLYQKKLK